MADGSIRIDIEARDTGLTQALSQAKAQALGLAAAITRSTTAARADTAQTMAHRAALIQTAGVMGNLRTGFLQAAASASALSSSLRAQQKSMGETISAMLSSWSAAVPSFQRYGREAGAGLTAGFRSGSAGLTGAAQSGAASAYGAMAGQGWGSLGYSISAGVAGGIRSGSSLITAAARQVAQAALTAAKRSLGIHSPSRVFREEIGQMIPAGMAAGITDGTAAVTEAMTRAAGRLTALPVSAAAPTHGGSARYAPTASVAPIRVETPVYLDGREIARATAKYQGREMAYLEGLL